MRYVKKDVFGEEYRIDKFINMKLKFEAEGYKIFTDVYINNKTMFETECNRGHKYDTNWNRFDSGKRCRKCFEEDVIKSAEAINKELELSGCKLIGEYHGSEKTFNYLCVCGNSSKIRIGDFRNGVRCSRCAGERIKESNRNKRKSLLDNFISKEM